MRLRRRGRTVDGMSEYFDTVIVGGGQAGLTAGYYLSQQGGS